jgi:hypothetical protein
MRPLHLTALALCAIALVGTTGCADGDADGNPRDWDLTTEGRKGKNVGPDGRCAPDTCQTLGKTSGTHPDGCGATLDCGKASSDCTPKTCEELGRTSGTTDDGCGAELDCSGAGTTPTTCSDSKASNSTKEAAADLGTMEDGGFGFGLWGEKVFPDLKLADGAEDWFRLKVSDVGFNGNPRITVEAPNTEVSVFYVCDAKGDASVCPDSTDTADNLIGKGCRGKATVTLKAYCDTWDESGTAFIRVRKAAASNQCMTYALTINVD